jgi:tetratricopeptide (TPR) repeat protein
MLVRMNQDTSPNGIGSETLIPARAPQSPRKHKPMRAIASFCLWVGLAAVAAAQVTGEHSLKAIHGFVADGLYELAIEESDATIAAHPGSAAAIEAVFLRAQCLRTLGHDSIDDYRRYVALAAQGPHADECLYRIGVELADEGATAAAIDTLTLLVENHKASAYLAHALMRRARLVMAENRSAAVRDLLRVVEEYPEHALTAYARHDLAVLYLRGGQPQDALAALRPLTEEGLPEVLREPVRLERARAHLRLGENQAVVDLLSSDADITAQRLLGEALLALERYDDAIRPLRSAAEADGPQSNAAYSLGWCLFQIGDIAAAEEVWARFSESTAELKFDALLGAADAARELRANERCRGYCEEVIREADGDREARALLCLGLVSTDPDTALAFLEQVAAVPGVDARTLVSSKMTAGSTLLRGDDASGAAEHYRAALEIAQDHNLDTGEAEYGYALALLRAGRTAEAARIMMGHSSGKREALLAAEAHIADQNWSAAEMEYRRILELNLQRNAPERIEALFGVGWCRLSAQDVTGALEWFDRVAEQAAESPRGLEALLRLGDAATLAGNDPEAVELYGLYLQRQPQGVFAYEAQLGRARAFLRLERQQEAVAAARAARQRAAGDGDAVAEALLTEARALFDSGEFSAAETLYLQAADEANSQALAEQAVYRVGDCRFNRHDAKGAAEAYALVVRTFPSGTYLGPAVQGLYWAAGASHGKIDADALISELIAAGGEAAGHIALERALIHRDQGELDAARDEFGSIARDHAGTYEAGEALYFLGTMADQPNNAAWRTLARDYPHHSRARSAVGALAEAALMDGNPREAEEWAKSLPGDTAEEQLLQGLVQAGLGRADSAIIILSPLTRMANEAASLGEQVIGWRARVALATQVEAQGDTSRALGLLEEAVANAPPSVAAEALYRQGERHYRQQQFDTALRAFLKIRYLYPNAHGWCRRGELAAGSCYEALAQQEKARELYGKLLSGDEAVDSVSEKAAQRLRELGE